MTELLFILFLPWIIEQFDQNVIRQQVSNSQSQRRSGTTVFFFTDEMAEILLKSQSNIY